MGKLLVDQLVQLSGRVNFKDEVGGSELLVLLVGVADALELGEFFESFDSALLLDGEELVFLLAEVVVALFVVGGGEEELGDGG